MTQYTNYQMESLQRLCVKYMMLLQVKKSEPN
jgi:hypothetical protein